MTIAMPVVHATITPRPSPATVAALRARMAARLDRTARWNADIDVVVTVAQDADADGIGVRIVADYVAGTITAEPDDRIPAGYALVRTTDDIAPRMVHLSTINLARTA